MNRLSSEALPVSATIDWLTLVAISALAYIIAVGLHEHLGHSTACVLLGSHPKALGAFYSDCDYAPLSDRSIRLVALAGPVVSLLTGAACFLVLRRLPPRASAALYFVWLLGTIGFMSATGYLLFSGFLGVGDFGTTRDGVFYGAHPEWLWRLLLILLGAASYVGIILLAVRAIESHLGGSGITRMHSARMIAVTSYITGAVIYSAIGLLNPEGLTIVLVSVLPSGLGATSGLLWMMQLLNRNRVGAADALSFTRKWGWIMVAAIITIGYALVLGPTIRPT